MGKISSQIKEYAIRLSKVLVKNEINRKKLVVLIYNLKILFKKTNTTCSIFDYTTLLSNKRFFCHEFYKGNFLYGIAKNLRIYSNYNKPIEACIEHGVYFGDYINKDEVLNSGFKSIITFGDSRKKIIQKYNPNMQILCIGPYIHYAKSTLTKNEINKIKKENGKTLLFFPSHSVGGVNASYNYDSLINEINIFKNDNGFKTVLICLYYKDIENGSDIKYKNSGFKVVSAGRREDPDFLNRLKDLILLSDCTASNTVGTHVGYSICLNKPHVIFQQKIKYDVVESARKKDIENINDDLAIKQKNEITEAFRVYSKKITTKQLHVCEKYWGFNHILSTKDLLDKLKELNKLQK